MLRLLSSCFLLLLVVSVVQAKDEIPKNLIAGKQVPKDAKLAKGDKLVAVYEKKNYLVEIREVQGNKKLRIRWIETHEDTPDVAPDELYYIGDATPTRKARTSPLPEKYRAYDKNGDGQIALYEWDRAKYAEFKKLDKNHDGFLTPHELAEKTTPAVASADPESPAKEADDKKVADDKDKVTIEVREKPTP